MGPAMRRKLDYRTCRSPLPPTQFWYCDMIVDTFKLAVPRCQGKRLQYHFLLPKGFCETMAWGREGLFCSNKLIDNNFFHISPSKICKYIGEVIWPEFKETWDFACFYYLDSFVTNRSSALFIKNYFPTILTHCYEIPFLCLCPC